MLISPHTAQLLGECTQLRQQLHSFPEPGFEEYKTQEFILKYLAGCAADSVTKTALTGVKAVWYARHPRKTIALRADIDALYCTELNDVAYRSRHDGYMHACGHDGHTAMLLTVAHMLATQKDELRVNVVLLFQPAEEGRGGAKKMIADGALENPHVDVIYGAHLWPELPKGKIGVRWGPMMAQTCEFDVTVHGVSAHGASPQLGVDAVVVAAQFVSILQTAITRSVDPHQDALLTIGKINGGTARNIIADYVQMNATLRVFSPQVYGQLIDRICSIANGLSLAFNAKFEINELMQYPCVNNPRPLVENFYTHVDMDDVVLVEPAMAAEDFACYQERIPGLFFFLGAGGGKNSVPLHNCRFDFDEDAMLGGIQIFADLLGII